MPDNPGTLEEKIVSNFLTALEESEDISDTVSGVISQLSEHKDFDGRERIAELVLEEVGNDAD